MLAQPEQAIDVKIDRGGIRDIEFLVQCLQRVYGGAEPWLRSGGTLFSLQKLHDKGHISGKEFHDLTSAYEFLRHLEHRLQLREGRQTHRLTATEADSEILQRAMEGFAPGEHRVADLAILVQRRMRAVAEIYQRIIFQQQTRGRRELRDAEFKLLSPLEPAMADQSGQHMLERLATDAPALYEITNRPDLSQQARRNVHRFLASAFTSSHLYAVLVRHQKEAGHALSLFDASDYLTEILVRHPEEIATLAEIDESGHPFRGRVVIRGCVVRAGIDRAIVDRAIADRRISVRAISVRGIKQRGISFGTVCARRFAARRCSASQRSDLCLPGKLTRSVRRETDPAKATFQTPGVRSRRQGPDRVARCLRLLCGHHLGSCGRNVRGVLHGGEPAGPGSHGPGAAGQRRVRFIVRCGRIVRLRRRERSPRADQVRRTS